TGRHPARVSDPYHAGIKLRMLVRVPSVYPSVLNLKLINSPFLEEPSQFWQFQLIAAVESFPQRVPDQNTKGKGQGLDPPQTKDQNTGHNPQSRGKDPAFIC